MRPIDLARLVLLGTIWGSSFLLIKIGLEGFSPLQITGGRIAVAALVLVVAVRLRRLRLPSGRDVWGSLAVVAVVSNIIPFVLISWGEEHISSGMAAILNSTTPLFTALLASFVLVGEHLGAQRIAGILVGFLGVAVIVGLDTGGSVTGQLAVVAASASYGVGFVYVRSRLSGRGGAPMAFSAGQTLVGAGLVALPVAAELPIAAPHVAAGPVLAVTALGAIGTGFAYILYYRLIEDVGATSASFVTYLIPVVGVVLGFIFRDERLGWNTLAGAVMVVGGIALAERGARRARAALEPAEVVDTS